MNVIIVHVITVHSIMLCYPIIINVSNIKENTPTYILIQAHAHTCTHANVHADLYHNLNKTERLCVSASIGISSACQLQSQPWLMQIFIYYRVFLNM